MAIKTITELKEYFKVGKRPTEAQFGDVMDSFANLEDPQLFPKNYIKKGLGIEFPNQVADQAIDILFGNRGMSGSLEVEIVGTWMHENTVGNIKKLFQVGFNPDHSVWYTPTSRIVEAAGPIINHIYIGDMVWDANINQYKITIYHTHYAGNIYDVRITYHCPFNTQDFSEVKLSDVYTNPLVGQRVHYINYNDNLGVGTTLPETSLHVKAPKNQGHSNVVGVLFDRSEAAGGSNIVQMKYHSTADLELNSFYTGSNFRYGNYGDFNIVNNINEGVYGAINFVTNASVRLSVKPNGNVGVGISNPKQRLTVAGNEGLNQGGVTNGQSSTAVLRLQPSNQGFGEVFDFGMNVQPSYAWIQPQDLNNPNSSYDLALNPLGGNVGIGTKNPDQKLTVKGKIHAEDVIVDTNVPADYVFQKYYDNYSSIRADYHMPDLQELEAYIKENKHLPEIPSGETIMKDGVKVGDFQMKLLQKIEELTLYMISQNKEIENLKTLIN